jgi:purine nucleosidase
MADSRDFLIDTDTASDDAVALIMALRADETGAAPGVRVRALTVVSGNVHLKQATANALYVVELCGADVPVFAGCDRPMLRERADAEWFHGKDGLGDQNYPAAKARARSDYAVDAIIDTVRRHPGIELATLGPLTNVALAVLREPAFVKDVRRCIVMGGNPCCVGNVTPAAEYNIWCDPEAAQIVFRSGLPIELVGWQLCRGEANLNREDIARVRALDTPQAHFAIDCNRVAMEANRRQSGAIGIALPDPVAMAVALRPETIVRDHTRHRVLVEAASELTRGQTVVDQLNVTDDERNRALWVEGANGPAPTIDVIWNIDVPAWKELLFRSLR